MDFLLCYLQEYKPPTALDIPVDMRVTLLPNASNPYGVLNSKGMRMWNFYFFPEKNFGIPSLEVI